jgi:2,3-bisphosphoglycerate-independent phosphoglycerate mutase
VRVSGPGLSDCITGILRALLVLAFVLNTDLSGTDPLKDNLPLVSCTPTSPPSGGPPEEAAVMTAKLVSELSDAMRSVLEQHPINAQRAKDGLALANVVLLR